MHKFRAWPVYVGMALLFAGIGVYLVWECCCEENVSEAIFIGSILLVLTGICLFMAMTMVRMDPSGITEYIGPFTLRHLPADRLRAVVKYKTSGRSHELFGALVFSSLPAAELEAQGERRLRKNPILRHDLKFREGKSDWGDLCLGGGFRRRGMLYVEFSEERKAQIQSLFPHAEYREAKLTDE